MATVGGVPLAHRALEGLAAAGASGSITVVLQVAAAEWMRTEGIGGFAGATTIAVSTPSSLHSLVEGLRTLPPGPVLCTMVDTVLPLAAWRRVGAAMRRDLDEGADAVIVVAPPLPDDNPLSVTMGPDRRVREFPTVSSGEPVTAGIYLLGPSARDHATSALGAGVERMRGFLRSLVRLNRITAVPVDRAIDVDHAADLAMAEHWLSRPDLTPTR
jgi:NDP-sugar pyrophosphorylase family protein